MHNSLTRLQTAFGFFTSCAFTLAALVALLSVIPLPIPSTSPSATISVRNVQVVKGRPHYYSTKREEYAQIRFDLDADLSSLFTWNTKQVFVYVTANYPPSPKGGSTRDDTSEAVIWDMIIPATSTPFSYQSLRSRYFPAKSTQAKRPKVQSAGDKSKATTRDVTLPGRLHLQNQKPKYVITDPSGTISRKANATLQVSWNVQPWVGALLWDQGLLGKRVGTWEAGKVGRSEAFDFPPLKGTKTDVVKDSEGPKTPIGGEATPVVEV